MPVISLFNRKLSTKSIINTNTILYVYRIILKCGRSERILKTIPTRSLGYLLLLNKYIKYISPTTTVKQQDGDDIGVFGHFEGD